MSLVGTRPPTVDEWDKYELHHRARLATKPGLTGMWQVSGRSNITDLVSIHIFTNDSSSYINIVRREVARYYCALHMCANETRRIVYENIGLSQI